METRLRWSGNAQAQREADTACNRLRDKPNPQRKKGKSKKKRKGNQPKMSGSKRIEQLLTDGSPITSADFPPQADGRRFQVRVLNGGWQVYGLGLIHVCCCTTEGMADMVADALEAAATIR
jgi:hypothetical protein